MVSRSSILFLLIQLWWLKLQAVPCRACRSGWMLAVSQQLVSPTLIQWCKKK